MHYRESLLFPFLLLVVVFVFAIGTVALNLIDPPPMVGIVTDKDRHPAYYPVDANTPEVFVLAITDSAGHRCSSWVVSEERWNLYNVGDPVEWWPKFRKEDS